MGTVFPLLHIYVHVEKYFCTSRPTCVRVCLIISCVLRGSVGVRPIIPVWAHEGMVSGGGQRAADMASQFKGMMQEMEAHTENRLAFIFTLPDRAWENCSFTVVACGYRWEGKRSYRCCSLCDVSEFDLSGNK